MLIRFATATSIAPICLLLAACGGGGSETVPGGAGQSPSVTGGTGSGGDSGLGGAPSGGTAGTATGGGPTIGGSGGSPIGGSAGTGAGQTGGSAGTAAQGGSGGSAGGGAPPSGGTGGDVTSGGTGGGGESGSASTDGCGGGSAANLALVGWATQNGGTTGGKGGTRVTVSNGADLLRAIGDKDPNTPLTIVVSGAVTPDNSGGASKIDIKDVTDVSLIGAGSGADFDGIGIKIMRASNIVLRNLRVHHVLTGDKDAISIEGPVDHVWVDHCELSAEYQNVGKDYYDGLLDAKAETEYLTYSWNYLHDSWKMMLVGSSESDTFDRKLTIHHNRFVNINSRLPLFRGGNGHVFNNFFQDIGSTAINSRLGACLRVENNSFVNTLNPWVSAYSDELGGGEVRCNLLDALSRFEYSSDTFELPACTAQVPYDYSGVLSAPSAVRALVEANAGVGKLTDPEAF